MQQQIYINFNAELGTQASKRLMDAIRNVDNDDEIIISLDNRDAHQADQLFSILEKHEFQYLPKGDETGERYYILAKRR